MKTEIFTEPLISFGVEGEQHIEWFIRLNKNIYGLKDIGMAWFEKLKKVMEARDFFHHMWIHVYGIRKKWSYYFMLMNADCSFILRIKLMKYMPLFRNILI